MALNAADCFMPFLQGINGIVVERYDSPRAIVTIQTVFTMFSAVLGDKFTIGIFMTGQAAYFIAGKTALCVAIFTNHLRRIKTNLVPGQAKAAQRLMIDIAERYFADDNLAAPMFNVAALALFGAGQTAVQPHCFRTLARNLDVAILALVFGDAMNRGVAVGAIFLEHGVGIITTQRFPIMVDAREEAGAEIDVQRVVMGVNGRSRHPRQQHPKHDSESKIEAF